MADITVYSPDQQAQLLIEVKGNRGISDEWAAKLRSNLSLHGVIPESSFFLLATPDYFYLWKPDILSSYVKADYKISAREVLEPYLEGIDLNEIGEWSLGLLVSSWLNDLLISGITGETKTPSDWVSNSGLYDRIKDGHVAVESAA